MAQHPAEVVDFDLLASAVGGAERGAVAGLDDEVGQDLVEAGDGGGERWRGVGEGVEEFREVFWWEDAGVLLARAGARFGHFGGD